jgi:hypothetical protein
MAEFEWIEDGDECALWVSRRKTVDDPATFDDVKKAVGTKGYAVVPVLWTEPTDEELWRIEEAGLVAAADAPTIRETNTAALRALFYAGSASRQPEIDELMVRLEAANAICRALPLDADDEAIADAMVAKRQGETRPLTRREAETAEVGTSGPIVEGDIVEVHDACRSPTYECTATVLHIFPPDGKLAELRIHGEPEPEDGDYPIAKVRALRKVGHAEPVAQGVSRERVEALLRRIVKYAREDRARTPRKTRLARALEEAEHLLADAENG